MSRGIVSSVNKNKRRDKKARQAERERSLIKDSDLFKAIKPKRKFTFRSDYFEIDGSFATILTVMHQTGSDDRLTYFWGIDLIPRGVGNDLSVRRLEHVGRVSESWVEQHQGRAEGLLGSRASEINKDGSLTSRQKLNKEQEQMVNVAEDLMNGASYLRVAIRLLVKAGTLEKLDDAVNKINRQYKDRFDTVFAAPYIGEQKRELSNLLNKVDNKMGRNFMFTSAEYSGNYSLVTRGIEDSDGEYVGQMEGDVNNSAVLMNLNNYESHVVLAGRAEAKTLSGWDFKGERGVDTWGVKIAQDALINNRRVVHLVLNRAKIGTYGADLSDITSHVNMTQGDINPFEMFGERIEALNVFPAHLEKLALMVEQLQPMTAEAKSRIISMLKESLVDFYVDKKMWYKNAQENRDRLRIIGIPHKQVPKLPEFLAYLDMEYKHQVDSENKDPKVMDAYGFLRAAFRDMLDSNGDLFNTTTSSEIDRAAVSSRVIYDFSSLIRRGRGLMMSQFVNALGYSVGNLRKGDVVLLHGADQLDPNIKPYVRDMFDQLHDNGVRIVFIYNSIDRMIEDREFNHFDSADYTLLGGMTASTIDSYERTLKQEVPVNLKKLLEHKISYRYYLRRGFDNVVFRSDIQMGFDLAELR